MNVCQTLQDICAPYVHTPNECDGLTRLIHAALDCRRISHDVLIGTLSCGDDAVPHWWITVPDPDHDCLWIIDYRARMWLGDHAHIPHGVFVQEDFPMVRYDGETVILESLPDWLLEVMACSVSAGVALP